MVTRRGSEKYLALRSEVVADFGAMGVGVIGQKKAEDVLEAFFECSASRWFVGALEELHERAARHEYEIGDHLHFFWVFDLLHDAGFDPMKVRRLKKPNTFRDVGFPALRQDRIFAA